MVTSQQRFSPGFFSGLDTIHAHVDGGVARELVNGVVTSLIHKGYPTRLTSVQDAAVGPQRQDLPPTYQSHTPGTDLKEELEYFSTTLFKGYSQAISGLRVLLGELSKQPGIVIEVERVIGKIDGEILWTKTPLREIPIIHSVDVGFQRSNTLPVEIHYGCDIKKKPGTNDPPLSLETLLDISEELEIRVGGWFIFEKDDVWCYRSNMFEAAAVFERVKKQHDDLCERLKRTGRDLGFECDVKALVERSLGVWKTPLTVASVPRRANDFKEPEELAKWEEDYENLESFWVVAGNFLGDLREDVYRAMVENLWKGVQYTYFLRSFADVQRLRQLAIRLSREVPFAQEYIKAVLLNTYEPRSADSNLEGEYFIANPMSPSAQTYKLVRTDEKVLKGARLIRSTETTRLTAELKALIDSCDNLHACHISTHEAPRPVARAIVYTDLKDSTAFQERFGDANWESSLVQYDLIVANEVSRLQGEVVKNLGDGYLLVFEQAGDALLCAKRLQEAINIYNSKLASNTEELRIPPNRIALDFGFVTRVLRAHGFDYAGKTLSRCARLIQSAHENEVLMLNTFRDSVVAAFPYAWIAKNIKSRGPIEFKGLEGSYEIWEFCWVN